MDSPLPDAANSKLSLESFKSLGFHGIVLDLGCREGKWFPLFKELGVVYFGIDQNQIAVRTAWGLHSEGSFFTGNVFRLSKIFKAAFFDCVFSEGFLQQFSNAQKEEILREVKSILRRDGLMVIAEGYLDKGADDDTDDRIFTVKGWQAFMERNGFRSLDVKLPFLLFRST